MYKTMKIRKIPALLIITLVFAYAPRIALMASSFYDVPDDTLYSPYIQKLYDAHLITGDTDNGKETYRFRPKDSLTRAEFTKVAVGVKLAEKYGISEDWQSKSAYEITETVLKDKLLYFHGCSNADLPNCTSLCGADICGVCNVCQLTNEKPFTDVAVKSRDCEEKDICTPWYSEYIYYALRKGMVKGYPEGSGYAFHPDDPILRIHALKLIMADDGAVDPEADERYRRLSQEAKSRGSYYPKCLSGAENFILNQNGGGADAQKLLKYALLADKLDFFGNTCQIFNEAGARTPEARATFLHSTLTRQEVARYFVLSTSYAPLQYFAADDPTVEEVVSNVNDPDSPAEDKNTPFIKSLPQADSGSPQSQNTLKTAPPSAPDPSLPASIITVKKSIRICGDTGCRTVPPGGELETLIVLNTGNGLVQNIVYDGTLYTVSCENLRTAECLEAMAKGDNEADDITGAYFVASADLFASYTQSLSKRTLALANIASGKATAEDCRLLGYSEEQIKSLLETQVLAIRINKNMEAEYSKSGDAVKTCKMGLGGKKAGTVGYKAVMTWCNGHGVTEEDLKPQKIDREYTATFKEETWNGTKATFPEFSIKKRGNTDSFQADSSRPLYILVHGWMGSADGWINTTADILEGYRSDAQILVVDWKNIAEQGLTPSHVTPLMEGMGTVIAEALDEWGASKEKTTFIAHSLGTIMSAQTAEKMTEGKGYPNLILLDPLASFSENKINYDDLKFRGFNGRGVCLVADDGLLSSETLLGTCGNQFLIEYDDPKKDIRLDELNENFDFTAAEYVEEKLMLTTYKLLKGSYSTGQDLFYKVLSSVGMESYRSANKHLWVTDTYQTISWSPFADSLLTLDGIKNGGADLDVLSGGLNGIIYTEKDAPLNIKYLKIIQSGPDNPDMYTLLGNTRTNNFECKEDKDCFMLGGKGGDSFSINRHHTDSVIGDFRQNLDEDKLIVGKDKGKPSFEYTENGHDHSERGVEIEIKYGGFAGSSEVVFIEGVNLDEVEEWVKTAIANIDLDPKDQLKNPIIIK